MPPRSQVRAASARAANAPVLVRAEVVSPTEFQLVLDGPRSQCVHEQIVAELSAVAGISGSWLTAQLETSDSCVLDATLYLPLHIALASAGRNVFFWVPLPFWVSNSLPVFGGLNEPEVDRSVWLPEGLMPYQQLAVRRAVAQNGRVLLADEMGLGKTAQAVSILGQYLDGEGPALIITPSSLGSVWREQLTRWLPYKFQQGDVQLVGNPSEVVYPQARIVIISYILFVRAKTTFHRTQTGEPWKIVVVDEAHYLRNPSSQRTRAILPLLEAATRVVLVTGTPTPKQASEAFTLVHGIKPSIGVNFKEWCERYGSSATERREAEVSAVLQELMVRRLKTDVLDQLPPKQRQRINVQLPASASSVVARLQAEKDNKNPDLSHFRELALLKEAAAVDYVDYLVEASSQKFLLFGHHRNMLEALDEALTKRGISFIRIDGLTPVQERPGLVRQFQSDPSCRVGLLSVLAAGEGLTLTAASLCVFVELYPAVPGVIEQAEARIHRIGQKSKVDVHFLIVESTRDEIVFNRLEARSDAVARIIGEQPQIEEIDPCTLCSEDVGEVPEGRDSARRAPVSTMHHRARLCESVSHDAGGQAVVGNAVGDEVTQGGDEEWRERADVDDQWTKPAVVEAGDTTETTSVSTRRAPAANPRKRRRKGMDIGSVLGGEIERMQADLAEKKKSDGSATADAVAVPLDASSDEMPLDLVAAAAAAGGRGRGRGRTGRSGGHKEGSRKPKSAKLSKTAEATVVEGDANNDVDEEDMLPLSFFKARAEATRDEVCIDEAQADEADAAPSAPSAGDAESTMAETTASAIATHAVSSRDGGGASDGCVKPTGDGSHDRNGLLPLNFFQTPNRTDSIGGGRLSRLVRCSGATTAATGTSRTGGVGRARGNKIGDEGLAFAVAAATAAARRVADADECDTSPAARASADGGGCTTTVGALVPESTCGKPRAQKQESDPLSALLDQLIDNAREDQL